MTSNDTLTLRWEMDDEAWSHWTQGRGRKTVSDVIREGIDKLRRSGEVRVRAQKLCANLEQSSNRNTVGKVSGKHSIAVELSAADWGEACQLAGEPGSPVSPGAVLAAIVLESESWKQDGNLEAEKHSGWVASNLIIATTTAALTDTQTFRFGKRERILGYLIAGSSVIIAICAVIELCMTS